MLHLVICKYKVTHDTSHNKKYLNTNRVLLKTESSTKDLFGPITIIVMFRVSSELKLTRFVVHSPRPKCGFHCRQVLTLRETLQQRALNHSHTRKAISESLHLLHQL